MKKSAAETLSQLAVYSAVYAVALQACVRIAFRTGAEICAAHGRITNELPVNKQSRTPTGNDDWRGEGSQSIDQLQALVIAQD